VQLSVKEKIISELLGFFLCTGAKLAPSPNMRMNKELCAFAEYTE
jgi:hypothetical protein